MSELDREARIKQFRERGKELDKAYHQVYDPLWEELRAKRKVLNDQQRALQEQIEAQWEEYKPRFDSIHQNFLAKIKTLAKELGLDEEEG